MCVWQGRGRRRARARRGQDYTYQYAVRWLPDDARACIGKGNPVKSAGKGADILCFACDNFFLRVTYVFRVPEHA